MNMIMKSFNVIYNVMAFSVFVDYTVHKKEFSHILNAVSRAFLVSIDVISIFDFSKVITYGLVTTVINSDQVLKFIITYLEAIEIKLKTFNSDVEELIYYSFNCH